MHALFDEIKKGKNCLHVKLYDWEHVGGVKINVTSSGNMISTHVTYTLLWNRILRFSHTHLEEQ